MIYGATLAWAPCFSNYVNAVIKFTFVARVMNDPELMCPGNSVGSYASAITVALCSIGAVMSPLLNASALP